MEKTGVYLRTLCTKFPILKNGIDANQNFKTAYI